MEWIEGWAYNYNLGPFPLIVIVGFATYALFFVTAGLVSLKRWIRGFRRVSVKVHRAMAITAILLATIHLLMGLSVYV